ncbi:MAG TPA: arsenite methyltransferase [Gemmataceae bacterium]|nr:arsenite methyltransferase [Gemmataceae bacterium]
MSSVIGQVRDKYAAIGASSLSGEHSGVRAVAEAFGYTPEELASIPAEANMGLSCGNPTAFANLRPGEVVVDLGCGGGLDVLLAAPRVGPIGKAIGIDMTPAMIERARGNAAKQGLANVEFHRATIDKLPLPDASVDCIVSNCVINLAPDKGAVFREMFRVLKPGGRVAVSDIALKQPLPRELAESVAAYVGCVAGAIAIAEYERLLRAAGFASVQVVDTRKDLNAYAKVEGQAGCCAPTSAPVAACCTPPDQEVTAEERVAASQGYCGAEPDVHAGLADLIARYDVNEYAASVQVYAIKPKN